MLGFLWWFGLVGYFVVFLGSFNKNVTQQQALTLLCLWGLSPLVLALVYQHLFI